MSFKTHKRRAGESDSALFVSSASVGPNFKTTAAASPESFLFFKKKKSGKPGSQVPEDSFTDGAGQGHGVALLSLVISIGHL